MEDLVVTRFYGISNAVRKRRSQTSRRPRPDSQPISEGHDLYPFSSTSPSDDVAKASSDENAGCESNPNSKRKEFNLNQCFSQVSSSPAPENDKSHKNNKNDGGFHAFYNNEPRQSGLSNKRCSEGVLAPANWKGSSKFKDSLESDSKSGDTNGGRNSEWLNSEQSEVPSDGLGNESRVKKVKLKVGGVTRTIQANSVSNGVTGSGSTVKSSLTSDSFKPHPKQKGNSDDNHSSDKRSGLQGVPWKDFPKVGFGFGKEDSVMGKTSGKNASVKQGDRSEPVRKSKRVPKRRVLHGEFSDDGEEDDEIRYLEKLKTSKVSAVYRDDEEVSKKHRKLSSVSNMENAASSRSGKDDKKKSRSDRIYEDTDYEEEEETGSDGERDNRKKKKQRKESVDVLMDKKREMTLTTRQRALQSSKDASTSGSSLIEFPNGLPPAPPRKQKEKLSEVEQQIKKAEAAQRRKMQVEKAAKESEAEAIRKILGQDSSRKKREEKMKKRQEELAQEKAANARMLASSTIRYVMGPAGITLTFPEEMGLPSLFNSKPCGYPPPREKCAGPSCTNPYKYRDSKSKLPLCSLQCYKAVREQLAPENTS